MTIEASSTPIAIACIEEPVRDGDTYSKRDGALWWTVTVRHRNGPFRGGDYGVVVVAKDNDGNPVAFRRGTFIFPQAMQHIGARLCAEANRLIAAERDRAHERAAAKLRVSYSEENPNLRPGNYRGGVRYPDNRAARPILSPVGGRLMPKAKRVESKAPAPKPAPTPTPTLDTDLRKVVEAKTKEIRDAEK